MKTPTLTLALLTAALAWHTQPASSQTLSSPAAGPTVTPTEVAARPEGFIMRNGQTFLVQNGVATPLTQEMTLRVTPQGITGFDRLPRTLTADSMLTLDGRIITIPTDLVIALPPAILPAPVVPPVPAAAADTARRLDRGVEGQNTSGLAPAQPVPRRSEEGAAVLPGTPADRAAALAEAEAARRIDAATPLPTAPTTTTTVTTPLLPTNNPNAVRTDLPGQVPAPSPAAR